MFSPYAVPLFPRCFGCMKQWEERLHLHCIWCGVTETVSTLTWHRGGHVVIEFAKAETVGASLNTGLKHACTSIRVQLLTMELHYTYIYILELQLY